MWTDLFVILSLISILLLMITLDERVYHKRMEKAILEQYKNRELMEYSLSQEKLAHVQLEKFYTKTVMANLLTNQIVGENYVLNLYGYMYYLNGTRYLMSMEVLHRNITQINLERTLYYTYLLIFQTQLYLNDLVIIKSADPLLERLILRKERLTLMQLKAVISNLTNQSLYRKLSTREKLLRTFFGYVKRTTPYSEHEEEIQQIYSIEEGVEETLEAE
ncbi:MAG: hypothetical protein ABIH39_08185 [Candidatus Margulisiibacteriota bacterium]